jgi:hypothetical protein
MRVIAVRRKRTVLASAGLLALVLAVAGVSLAWTGHHHYRLGGGWIGSGSGLVYNALYIPLDPAGQKAAIRLSFPSYSAYWAAGAAALGADAASDGVGEAAMTSHDTFKWTSVGYFLKQGNPPEIRAISVGTGTATFTGVDSFNVKWDTALYAPTADADGDGFPDPGATPLMTATDLTGSAKRVPLP